jgi:hypothetical protein
MNEDFMKTNATALVVALIVLLAFSANGFSGTLGKGAMHGSSTGCPYREAVRANGMCPDVCPYSGMHRMDASTGCPYFDAETNVEGTPMDCPYLNGQQTDHEPLTPGEPTVTKDV